MFKKGDYVRLRVAPTTRMGTLTSDRTAKGQYMFRQDARFDDTIPESEVYEDEIEHCNRPSDQFVAGVNEIIREQRKGEGF